MGFDVGSFIGGIVVGYLISSVVVTFNFLKEVDKGNISIRGSRYVRRY